MMPKKKSRPAIKIRDLEPSKNPSGGASQKPAPPPSAQSISSQLLSVASVMEKSMADTAMAIAANIKT
jgi:hypothetical protein